MAKATIRKMKKVEEDYKSILARYKETKCEIEGLNDEVTQILKCQRKRSFKAKVA